MIVVMCFNDKHLYAEQAKVAITSIKVNSPNINIVAYIINSDTLAFDDVTCKYRKLKDIRVITAYSLMVMYETLLEYKEPILWLDVDILVRKSIDSIFDNIKPNTLMVLRRSIMKERNNFNVGVVGVGYSQSTLNMMRWSSEKAIASKEWYADQLYLYRGYLKYNESINLFDLTDHKGWHDIGGKPGAFNKDSAIWHCKNSHFSNPIYQKEYKHYLGMAHGNTI